MSDLKYSLSTEIDECNTRINVMERTGENRFRFVAEFDGFDADIAQRLVDMLNTPPAAPSKEVVEAHGLLEGIEDTLDKQTYDENVKGDFDLADDYTFSVELTAKQLREFHRGFAIIDKIIKAAQGGKGGA